MSAEKAMGRSLRIIEREGRGDLSGRSNDVRLSLAEMGVCQLCFGTGMECVPGKGARRCLCRKPSLEQKLSWARVPSRYAKDTLGNYYPVPGNGSQLRAHTYCFRLVSEYPGVDRGLLLVGPVGVGKTHLAAAVVRGLLGKGARCLFWELGALLKEIQTCYGDGTAKTEMEVLRPLYGADVLVLDELGSSKPTEWARDTVMQVVNTRYNERKLTVFTTNYFDVRGRLGEETLEERIGVRLRSRLYEMCETVVIDGEDYRRRSV